MIATTLSTISLFLHISAAVVGLGSTFALASRSRSRTVDPRHILFIHKLNLAVISRLAGPALAIILITGITRCSTGLSFSEPGSAPRS